MYTKKLSSRKPIRALRFLFETNAPYPMYKAYLRTYFRKKFVESNFSSMGRFKLDMEKGQFSNDWFTIYIPYWNEVFHKFDFQNKPIKALEVGSWEGMSSLFILSTLPKATLISVDTWEGADEHQGSSTLQTIEDNFDKNIDIYRDRSTKFKGTSFNFFNEYVVKDSFDLVYIDGSHHTDDVIIDAVKGFELLNVGGIMIFDDYFWWYYNKPVDNPAGAINAFLRLKEGAYEILCLYGQLILRKTRDGRAIP